VSCLIDVTTADEHGHWDVADIKRLCEHRGALLARCERAEAQAKRLRAVLTANDTLCTNDHMVNLYLDAREALGKLNKVKK
jgi:hypothetical protein